MKYKIGIGYDVHKFVKGRKLILGGINIPHTKGLEGHSDADVLLHSVCDALLGAAGFRDIGNQFPNTDMLFKDISSLILLEKTYKLLKSKRYKIENIDSMLILEEPKINKYIDAMKENISKIVQSKNISIKATTSEGLGFTGQKKGCVSYSIALIYR